MGAAVGAAVGAAIGAAVGSAPKRADGAILTGPRLIIAGEAGDDERLNPEVCGVVTHLFEQVDTTGLFNEWQLYLNVRRTHGEGCNMGSALRLAKGELTTTFEPLYQVPNDRVVVLKSIILTNLTGTAQTISLKLAGAYVMLDKILSAGESYQVSVFDQVIISGEIIEAKAGQPEAVDYYISGKLLLPQDIASETQWMQEQWDAWWAAHPEVFEVVWDAWLQSKTRESDGALIWQKQTDASDYAQCIAVSASGVYVGVNYQSASYVRKYNHTNGTEAWSSSQMPGSVRALAVNEDAIIVSTHQDYKVRRLNPSTGSEVHSYTIPSSKYADALAIEPGTNHYYTVDTSRIMRKHSFQTGEPIFQFNNANKAVPYKLLIDGENNIYTVSNTEITKLDNQLADYIWREDYPSNRRSYFYGIGLNKAQGKLYVLHQFLIFMLSAAEKQWSDFTYYQFEGTVNSVDVDKSGNFYGAGADWTVRKFNALGEQQWVHRHVRAVSFVKADKNGNVFIGDSSRILTKLNPYGVEQWSCNMASGTTGEVTDLAVNAEGLILVSLCQWSTIPTSRRDFLVKIDSEGILLVKKEISASGIFRKLHFLGDNTILATTGLYDISTLQRLRYSNEANAIFSVCGDFLFGVDDENVQVFNRYSGGLAHSFEVEAVNITNSFLRAVQGLDGAIYAWDNDKTLVKFNEKGDELWRYKTRDKIVDVKVDDEHNIFLTTGYYTEKLTQTFGIKGYEK